MLGAVVRERPVNGCRPWRVGQLQTNPLPNLRLALMHFVRGREEAAHRMSRGYRYKGWD